jgi:hypothetical protein
MASVCSWLWEGAKVVEVVGAVRLAMRQVAIGEAVHGSLYRRGTQVGKAKR